MSTTPFNPNDSAIARRSSITELCNAWTMAEKEIRDAFAMLQSAQDRINICFDNGSTYYGMEIGSTSRHNHGMDWKDPEAAIAELSRKVWQNLVGRLELRKLMSLKRIKELDEQLESGKGLPPITVSNIMAMLDTTMASASQFLEEKVHECYEMLRPRGWTLTKYKTNEKSVAAGVGHKVILTYAVRRSYGQTGGFEVQYGRTQDELRALDQVFHLLASEPAHTSSSWAGELCDAIKNQTSREKNIFETKFFRGRCFANNNLHLEMTRTDLVQQFNLIAGGARLQDTKL